MTAFDLPELRRQLAEHERSMTQPDFWQDNDRAQGVLKEAHRLKSVLLPLEEMSSRADDLSVMEELAAEEASEEFEQDIQEGIVQLRNDLDEWSLKRMLDDEKDVSDAILTIHPGAGGTESCDWAEMLLRMYLRWIERRGWESKILDILAGDEAGIKSVTMTVIGEYAYGYLKCEVGVHRLVRISPFDSSRRRHTSFVSVDVIPDIEDDIVVEIAEDDLRIDTYRSSGHGGQHVNKTDSAVRITHLPTKIVAQCQNERSQHRNKQEAMRLLKARLYDYYQKQREAEIAEDRGKQEDIAWGSQIRSYVLHPYRMIKDHRTDLETGDVDAVLDGRIDPFIEAFLTKTIGQQK